jgi:hypothetical protein
MAFQPEFYNLIETSFNYLFKYLIVFSLIVKNKNYITILKHSFSNLSYQDEFVNLFNLVNCDYDVENSLTLVKKCTAGMRREYFLHPFVDVFYSKCKEILLDNYIYLNSTLNVLEFAKYFEQEENKTKRVLSEFISINYPDVQVNDEGNLLKFNIINDDYYERVLYFIIFSIC